MCLSGRKVPLDSIVVAANIIKLSFQNLHLIWIFLIIIKFNFSHEFHLPHVFFINISGRDWIIYDNIVLVLEFHNPCPCSPCGSCVDVWIFAMSWVGNKYSLFDILFAFVSGANIYTKWDIFKGSIKKKRRSKRKIWFQEKKKFKNIAIKKFFIENTRRNGKLLK